MGRGRPGLRIGTAAACAGLALALAGQAHAASLACWFENGAVVVPAALDDIPGDWLIDFAAPGTLLHETRAQMEGIEADVTVSDLRFADQRIEGLPVAIADLDSRAPGFVPPIVGVIGDDVLGGYVVDIAFAPCRIDFYAPGHAPTLAGTVLPLTLIDGRPTVTAAVSDGTRTLEGPFVIDTASKAAVRLSIPVDHGPDDGDPRQWAPTWIRGLSVAGTLLERPSAALGAELPADVAGALGTGFLSLYRVRIDIAGGRLVLAQP